MWKSPNGTIRAILDGTVFRAPILVKGITPFIPNWTKPITIARHAYGDVYKNTEMSVPAGAKAELVVTKADGTEERRTIHDFQTPGIIQGVHNTDKSIAKLRARLLQLRAQHEAGPLVRNEGHDLQNVRPPLQGYFPGNIRRG